MIFVVVVMSFFIDYTDTITIAYIRRENYLIFLFFSKTSRIESFSSCWYSMVLKLTNRIRWNMCKLYKKDDDDETVAMVMVLTLLPLLFLRL